MPYFRVSWFVTSTYPSSLQVGGGVHLEQVVRPSQGFLLHWTTTSDGRWARQLLSISFRVVLIVPISNMDYQGPGKSIPNQDKRDFGEVMFCHVLCKPFVLWHLNNRNSKNKQFFRSNLRNLLIKILAAKELRVLMEAKDALTRWR